jgi:hypothetical protein
VGPQARHSAAGGALAEIDDALGTLLDGVVLLGRQYAMDAWS